MEGTCHMDVVNSVIVVSYPNNNSYARGIYVAPYNVVVFAIVVQVHVAYVLAPIPSFAVEEEDMVFITVVGSNFYFDVYVIF